MQILPADGTTISGGSTRQSALAAKQTALFARLLSDMATTSTGTTTETLAATSSASTSATSTAPSGNPLTASQLPSQEEVMTLPLTREDIAALSDDLQSQGFSESEIADMETKADSSQGMTWGDLLTAVKKKVASNTSEKKDDTATGSSDQAQLLSVFQTMGFTADQSQQLLDSLNKGDAESVWNTIKSKTAELGDDATVSLDGDQMAAFAKAFNLSDDSQNRLRLLFDQAGTLNKQGINSAVGVIQGELTAKFNQESQSLQAFQKAAASVLQQSWEKNNSKKQSDLHEDEVALKAVQAVSLGGGGKKSDPTATAKNIVSSEVNVTADLPQTQTQSQTQTQTQSQTKTAEKTAQHDDTAVTNQLAAAVKTDAGEKTGRTQDETVSDQTASTKAAAQGQEKNAVTTVQSGQAKTSLQMGGDDAQGQSSGQSDQSAKDGQNAWGTFWSKVRSEEIPTSTTGKSSIESVEQTVAGLAALGTTATSRQGTTATTRTANGTLAQQAARQLESGVLRNLGQGTKQLTLSLNPDELGKLSVTLTVKDKEVRATITADKTDTAVMLQDQAAKIKQNLESQGFKVTKLDVQTGLAQDNSQNWQSPEQHNMAREQREALERARTSLRLSQLASGMETTGEQLATTALSGTMATQSVGLDLFT